MSRHASRFNKRDQNEAPILKALARIGVEWIEAGPLDGWCVLKNQFIPVEIKMPEGRLTEDQREFIGHCEAYGRPCFVWRSAAEAVKSIKEWRERA